ncbi:hypothetical protein Salat_2643000 [Sesamum alatum]|uniref:Uncharacterized protein n=1 Tax=Sesamum alatum TaxID=300844 RepID=A0AAE2CAV6_9LAMI|nr:hypothetical protein Salat_2643000 [Sesamum alatum]
MLAVQTVTKHAKYLGFALLMNSWRLRKLSQVGRGVLLQAVIDSIPIYAMGFVLSYPDRTTTQRFLPSKLGGWSLDRTLCCTRVSDNAIFQSLTSSWPSWDIRLLSRGAHYSGQGIYWLLGAMENRGWSFGFDFGTSMDTSPFHFSTNHDASDTARGHQSG